MKNTAKNLVISATTVILFIIVSFSVVPTMAKADYYDYNGAYNYSSYNRGYYNNYFGTPYISNTYGYGRQAPQPVTYSVPVQVPVYYPVYTPVIQTYSYPVVVPVPVPVPVQVPVAVPVLVPQYQAYPMNSNRGLDIGCFVDPTNASINQPINWSVEVTGGMGPYTYSWTGSDGLTGNQSSVIKYYSTSGEKSAIVYVTSADGRTGSRACSNVITIRKAYVAPRQTVQNTAPVVKAQTQNTEVQNQTANIPLTAMSAFSLSYVPWGWVALLVIFVLFATVMYLLFNRPKI